MLASAQILGRVGKKENKSTAQGNAVTVLSIATNKYWRDSAGQSQEKTSWHNVSCFGKLSEVASNYTHVGDLVYIEGAIENTKNDDPNNPKWYYSITARNLKLLPQGNKKQNNKSQENEHHFDNQSAPMDDIPF